LLWSVEDLQGLAPVPAGASGNVADASTQGSYTAFMTGLHTTMLVAGVVTLAGAALGRLLRSTSPRHDLAATINLREDDTTGMREESAPG
jgi:H+/gluconate symporter-like permease